MERRRLAGMKPASLSHHRKIKKTLSQRHGGTEGKVTGWMEVDGIDCAQGGSTDDFV